MEAIVLGATGLVGSALVKQLVNDERFTKIKVIIRNPYPFDHPKIEPVIIDFDQPEFWQTMIVGDVLFSAFGTTLKKAGSKAAQYKIDFTYQYQVAKYAAKNGVTGMVLISSEGANSKSKLFYSQMKGELDDAIQVLPFESISIIKPSLLLGNRNEKRPMEKFGAFMGSIIKYLPFVSMYKPVKVEIVAKAMIRAYFIKEPFKVYHNLDVFRLAQD